MTAYFIRRFLLIIPTFLGITIMVFIVTRFVPGGPIERIIAEAQQMQSMEGGPPPLPQPWRRPPWKSEEEIVGVYRALNGSPFARFLLISSGSPVGIAAISFFV